MSALTLSGKIRELLKIMGLAVDLPLLEALQILEAAIGIVASGTWVERADRLKASICPTPADANNVEAPRVEVAAPTPQRVPTAGQAQVL